MRADLHTHSYYSDGQYSPEELLQMAKSANLDFFALSDHDTINGVEEAIQEGKKLGITVIPAIELSALKGSDVHIIGYGIDYQSASLKAKLEEIVALRGKRNQMILKKLEEFNMYISFDELKEYAKGKVMGRTHIGELMVMHGYSRNVKEAFDIYLGNNQRAFVGAFKLTVPEAIELVLMAKGVPVLAHPNQMKLTRERTRETICEFRENGLLGIEAYYYTHSKEDIEFYEKIADELDLIKTGGSDFHGSSRNSQIGAIPKEVALKDIERLIKGSK